MHKGDEEKKPAAKNSNYLVEKKQGKRQRWICTVASSGAKQSVRASDFPQTF
jgi:hypothetical protein